MTDVRDLPFDQFQRYELVRVLLESVRSDGKRFRILDVGGRTALLREFLPLDQVELVDVVPSEAEGLVLGSGAELPFQDGAFDAVCAFDTLEHVPAPLRDDFVRECARVAQSYVILAGPYDSPRVAEAEETLLDFLRSRLNWEHEYLLEHRVNGLPSMPAALGLFEDAGARTVAIGHGELSRWLALMCVELYIEHETLLKGFAPQLYRFYNEHLFPFDHGSEVYRHAVIAAFGDAPLPTVGDALREPSTALSAADTALSDAARELLRYDSLRDSYLPELNRLHGVVASLEEDLVGHRLEAADLSGDLAGHAETVSALRSECEEVRDQAERDRSDFTRERAEVKKVISHKDDHLAQLEERAAALRADLEGHRVMLKDLEELRALELAELEARGRLIDGLNGDLKVHVDELAAVRVELDVRGERLEAVNQELSAQNEIIRRAHEQLEVTVQHIETLVGTEARARTAVQKAGDCEETLARRLERAKDRELSIEEEIEIIVGARDLRLAERNEARAEAAELAASLREAEDSIAGLQSVVEARESSLREADAERLMLREESQRLWNRIGRTVLLRWLTKARKLG